MRSSARHLEGEPNGESGPSSDLVMKGWPLHTSSEFPH